MTEMIAIAGLVFVAVIAALLSVPSVWSAIRTKLPVSPDVRRRFNNVYAMTTNDRREAIINFHMKRDGSTREQAMLAAIDDNARSRGRW